MADTFKVTKQVIADHPDGYQYVAAVPGDEILLERAIELGLAKRPAKAKETGDDAGADQPVITAEVRTAKKAAAKKTAPPPLEEDADKAETGDQDT